MSVGRCLLRLEGCRGHFSERHRQWFDAAPNRVMMGAAECLGRRAAWQKMCGPGANAHVRLNVSRSLLPKSAVKRRNNTNRTRKLHTMKMKKTPSKLAMLVLRRPSKWCHDGPSVRVGCNVTCRRCSSSGSRSSNMSAPFLLGSDTLLLVTTAMVHAIHILMSRDIGRGVPVMCLRAGLPRICAGPTSGAYPVFFTNPSIFGSDVLVKTTPWYVMCQCNSGFIFKIQTSLCTHGHYSRLYEEYESLQTSHRSFCREGSTRIRAHPSKNALNRRPLVRFLPAHQPQRKPTETNPAPNQTQQTSPRDDNCSGEVRRTRATQAWADCGGMPSVAVHSRPLPAR